MHARVKPAITLHVRHLQAAPTLCLHEVVSVCREFMLSNLLQLVEESEFVC